MEESSVPSHLRWIETLLRKPTSNRHLYEIWESHAGTPWNEVPDFYLQVGKRFVSRGELLLGHHILSMGLEAIFPRLDADLRPGQRPPPRKEPEDRNPEEIPDRHRHLHAPLLQQKALALAQLGSYDDARGILKRLDVMDGDTEGILARTYKDEAFARVQQGVGPGRASLLCAYETYFKGYARAAADGKHEAAFYNGINAATCAFFLSETTECQQLARKVLNHLGAAEEAEPTSRKNPWWQATMGEANLLLYLVGGGADTQKKARESYLEAVNLAADNHRDICSMGRQVRRLAARSQHVSVPDDLLAVFKVLTVVSFSASVQDPANQCNWNCKDLSGRGDVYNMLRGGFDAQLAATGALISFSTLSCPAEIMFVEAVMQRRHLREMEAPGRGGVEIHVLLPFEREEIVRRLPPHWESRFEMALDAATSRDVAGHCHDPETLAELRAFAAPVVHGRAGLKADALDATHVVLETRSDPNGVCGQPVRMSTPLGSKKAISPQRRGIGKKSRRQARHVHYLPLLYADIEGYGALRDQELVTFSMFFPPEVKKILVHVSPHVPARTQGDSILAAFENLEAALDAATRLRDFVMGTDWKGMGLQSNLRIRVALDAGPCCLYKDTVTKRTELCGFYVNRTARIEPITPPGEIFVSESFAALWRLEGNTAYRLQMAGRKVLPKGHGEVVAYIVRSPRAV